MVYVCNMAALADSFREECRDESKNDEPRKHHDTELLPGSGHRIGLMTRQVDPQAAIDCSGNRVDILADGALELALLFLDVASRNDSRSAASAISEIIAAAVCRPVRCA